MATQTFSATVSAWVRKSQRRMHAVIRESAQRVAEESRVPVGAGGNMPVETGALRASLVGTLHAPAPMTFRGGPNPPDQIALAIAGWTGTEPLFICYSMNYARHVEFGTNGRPGRGFVRLAAQNWQRTVDQVTKEAKARIKSG